MFNGDKNNDAKGTISNALDFTVYRGDLSAMVTWSVQVEQMRFNVTEQYAPECINVAYLSFVYLIII